MVRYGDKNEHLKFGVLEISNKEFDGFGAFAKIVLGGFMVMEEKGLLPFVDIKSNCYTEKHKINGTFNAFEYYFLQPCDVILNRHVPRSEVLQSANVEFISEAEARDVMAGYMESHGYYSIYDSQEKLEKAASLVRKYMRLNTFSEKIHVEVKNFLKGKGNMIGIHVRRGGFKVPIPGHAVAVEPAEHLEIFKKIRNGRKAFLATDDETVLEVFANDDEYKNGNVVWYEDVLRTPEAISNEKISIYCCEDKRENHKYKLGYEILKEILTLSYCESLIAGYSNVNLLASIVKMSRGERYKEYCIIDKGIWPMDKGYGWEYDRNRIKAKNRGFNLGGGEPYVGYSINEQ